MRVGIIGLGVIGSAQADMFAAHDLVTYDPLDDDAYPLAMRSCDFAIVCVGTPERPDGHADLTYVEQAVSDLPPGLPAVIRSTVPPGTTDGCSAAQGAFTRTPRSSWARTSCIPGSAPRTCRT
jgi:UDPglucose 6-dehydrogenase